MLGSPKPTPSSHVIDPTNSSQSDTLQVKSPILEKPPQQQLPKLKELGNLLEGLSD